jgi:hypothetical protein
MTEIIERNGIQVEVRPDGLFRKAVKGAVGGWQGTPHDMTTTEAIDIMSAIWFKEQQGTDLAGKTQTIKF